MLEMVKNIDLAPKMFMVLFENSMQLFHGRRFQFKIQAMNEEVSNCEKHVRSVGFLFDEILNSLD